MSDIDEVRPHFELGQVVGTPGALDVLHRLGVLPGQLLARHAAGDWGTVGAEDAATNDEAVRTGARILSAYGEGDDCVWLITEADRSVTTILRPDDY